uniref:GIY-YIG domain-containing protein n=1 Tax=viral metagenome TaxID=1070528 RepID=A0A6C0IA65_9ZZZZ
MAYIIPLSILDKIINIDNIDLTRSYVYVLELEDKRYYVGRTSNFIQRMNEHFTENGALYTKKYKPIKIKEVVEEKTCYDERDKTLEYMETYGWENVRGYAWCRETLTKKPKFKNTKESKQIKEYVICDNDIVIRDMYLLENKDVIEIGNYLNISPGSIAYTLEKMKIVNRRQLCRGYFDYVFSDLYEQNKKDKIAMKDKIKYQEFDNLENKSENSKLTKDKLKNIKSKLHNLLNTYKDDS